MKKTVILAIVAFITATGCKEDVEKSASRHLENAREAFSELNYSLAKQEIDSIRILYPKAFEARKQGLALMQEIEMAEQLRSIEYEDSMIALAKAAFEAIKGNYMFEKDEQYQDMGSYTIKSQDPIRNIERNYIRGKVDELGRMTLVSHYRGNAYIHHDQIRLNVGETYVETPVSDERHEFTDLGICYERLSFMNGNDGGAAAFINENLDKDITYTLYRQTEPGSKRAVSGNLKMNREDRYAIAQLYNLSQVLLSLNGHRTIRDEAERHLNFIRSRMKSTQDAIQENE
ncbi:MAG: hypothetical protein IKS24_05090 [Bacteroidaceae bacterium]|nr:hypothetical protein [Bacteroidaceae bacterium]